MGIAEPEETGASPGRNVREYKLRRNAFSQCCITTSVSVMRVFGTGTQSSSYLERIVEVLEHDDFAVRGVGPQPD